MPTNFYAILNDVNYFSVFPFPINMSVIWLLLREFTAPDWCFTVFYIITSILSLVYILTVITVKSATITYLKIGDDLKLTKID